MPEMACLKDADWLKDPALISVLNALTADGGKAQIAGGAVRDGLLGLPVNDIDIATTETPEQVIELAKRAMLKAHPTGLKHGTVTLVSDGTPFEVTTLRIDVKTFGRHATVSYTANWKQDASRRDFTINALFCDRDGSIMDLVGGLADLRAHRIRFVGEPNERIEEDYLRILRFFRFLARYGEGEPDQPALKACIAAKNQLTSLSRERIRHELLQLLIAPKALRSLELMERHGILKVLLPGKMSTRRFARLALLETAHTSNPSPLRRLAALCLSAKPSELRQILALSNDQTRRLEALGKLAPVTPVIREAERQALLYRQGSEAVIDAIMLGWSESNDGLEAEEWCNLLQGALNWKKPVFPVSGQDLINAGIGEGKELGRYLKALENWWIAEGFQPDKNALLSHLEELRQ